MFQGLSNLASMLSNARAAGAKMQQLGESLKDVTVEATAGGGLVTVTMTAAMEMQSCKIDPALLAKNDPEFLEDLITAATNQAIAKAREAHAAAMREAFGDMNIPGMEEAFRKMSGQ
jgi:DNA-binding YbaB/EbfC family protein